jgi:nucleoside-diphosphate-sugar epimerase
MEKILVIGCAGQIGSELVPALRSIYGDDNVVASDIKTSPITEELAKGGPFETLDILNAARLGEVVNKYGITQIYHLVAVLSALCEKDPRRAWQINMDSLFNVLELAREKKMNKIFWPSSIGAFGPTTPRINTPQMTIMEPNTTYGISKLAGERWVEYYWNKYGVDTRGIRYPGLISYKTEPGGGTTDYAVDIFFEAIKSGHYNCFLKEDTALPMMFMDDAIKGTIKLMESPVENISIRSSYNLNALSFTPAELYAKIKERMPEFSITYKADFRQKIADSWPASIDDSQAQKDWGWKPEFDLDKMVDVMLSEIKKKLV